jgi:hypothetical protein
MRICTHTKAISGRRNVRLNRQVQYDIRHREEQFFGRESRDLTVADRFGIEEKKFATGHAPDLAGSLWPYRTGRVFE